MSPLLHRWPLPNVPGRTDLQESRRYRRIGPTEQIKLSSTPQRVVLQRVGVPTGFRISQVGETKPRRVLVIRVEVQNENCPLRSSRRDVMPSFP
jgi:hypothetical protein